MQKVVHHSLTAPVCFFLLKMVLKGKIQGTPEDTIMDPFVKVLTKSIKLSRYISKTEIDSKLAFLLQLLLVYKKEKRFVL